MANTYDVILEKMRTKDKIPQETSDPTTLAEDSWVLNSGGYSFSYKTKEGATIRLTLS